MVSLSGATATGKQVFNEFSQKNVTFMAAGIAYNAFISLAPLLLVVLFVVSVSGTGLEDRIIELSQQSLPGPIADAVSGILRDNSGGGASAVGLLVLIWGTLKIFRGLDTAFSEIYETKTKNSFVDKLVDGIVVFVAMVVAILATVGVTAAFSRFSSVIPFVGYLTPLVLVVGLVLAFLPMYYRFPDTDVDWDHVWPGAAFAAVGWAAFQAVFQVYLSFTGGGSGDFFGSVIVIITWLYFSGLVLLLGAVINAVIGDHASEKAGGVGEGATGYETDREQSLSPDEFGQYLWNLREEITPTGDAGRAGTPDGTGRYRHPDGDVEVIEQSKGEDDGTKWEVAFRWRTDEPPEGETDPADERAAATED
ncbi:YihY/virulence factor BrkB family protein [Halostella sp. JP-L12]|uniref:YihY/virulence factor BrkB family protein n=1 Tax=Halostella TaxID=1843185 RepID=UPI000EF76441|nr:MULTISPECIES: YihY/virulence factor BrkB family protein [Halostella]NHN47351.1 YihY/virulence factor BrkB family protein [Halostella sp. JP-L12]